MRRFGIALVSFITLLSCSKNSEQSSPSRSAASTPSSGPTANASNGNSGDEQVYQRLLSRYGTDYGKCIANVRLRGPEAVQPARAEKPRLKNVIVAIDSSGSMGLRIGGETKMDAAKQAVVSYLSSLPPDVNVGLVAFGHKGNNHTSGKAISCAGVEVVYPLGQAIRAQLETTTQQFQATGWTPLAAAIRTAGAQFQGRNQDGLNAVYVVSDGMETCGGDPVGAASELHTQNVNTVVNIIGFRVTSAEQQRLRAVAQAGGGEFYGAQTGSQVQQILEEAQNTVQKTLGQGVDHMVQAYNASLTGAHVAAMDACFNAWLTNEQNFFRVVLNDPSITPEQRAYVMSRLQQRQAKIRAWQAQADQQLRSQNEQMDARLAAELQQIEKDFPSK